MTRTRRLAAAAGGKGRFRWKVKLAKGTYDDLCDPHASSMTGSCKPF
ncbi:MAG TPA: hypothetical protein VJ986_14010 [Gaiellaceae bacterium]|nr:hypothetical protein [Gaiellaceae bacterium]